MVPYKIVKGPTGDAWVEVSVSTIVWPSVMVQGDSGS